jgi:glycosyltransferase involved in cell wall biosynthesis
MLLEAMAMGLTVVTCSAAWRGTVIPQGGGIVVADDAGEFARCVIRLLSDERERDNMASLARRNAETFYRWDTQMALLDEVLAKVVARRRKQAKEPR